MSHVLSQIDDVVGGQLLSAEADAKFRAHLRGCTACREHYDRSVQVLRLARGSADALAPGEAQRLEVRAVRLAKPIAGMPSFPWRFAFAAAAVAAALVLTVAAWPRSPVGRVLAASSGLRLDGAVAGKDAVVFAGSELSTFAERLLDGVDADLAPGAFVLTGSQQLDLVSGLTQSLAGRVGIVNATS